MFQKLVELNQTKILIPEVSTYSYCIEINLELVALYLELVA